MKLTFATFVPVTLALSAMGGPLIDLEARQAPPPCDLTGCLSTIGSKIPGFIAPCEAAGANLQGIQQSQSQGQPPKQSDQFGLVANGAQCIALTISFGFAIPNACKGCPGATSQPNMM